ncbi:Uncharacterised protein [Bordetella pertussis]|nr:Uncharacterised protein [Bordetella pertussis]CPM72117.1 Uncharacterised protein [Bordetella pertussis]CPQ36467.1 Uncharacterised protein [Bordetella pertussis]CRE07013.1 Uncharacterised protein [Bordetella pertussis]CRE10010.1 Uncharacterised protein [Bordetella pertussis]
MAAGRAVQPGQLGDVAPAGALQGIGQRGGQGDAVAHAAQGMPGHAARRVRDDGQRAGQPCRADLFEQGGGRQHVGFQFHQRQVLPQRGGQLAQAQEVGLLARHAQVNHALQLALQLAGLGLELGAQHQQRLGGGQQRFAGLGQAKPARGPVEQRHAQALLQRLQLGGDGGLGQRQRFGGLGQIAQAGDGDEGADLVDLHGRSLRRAGAPARAGGVHAASSLIWVGSRPTATGAPTGNGDRPARWCWSAVSRCSPTCTW